MRPRSPPSPRRRPRIKINRRLSPCSLSSAATRRRPSKRRRDLDIIRDQQPTRKRRTHPLAEATSCRQGATVNAETPGAPASDLRPQTLADGEATRSTKTTLIINTPPSPPRSPSTRKEAPLPHWHGPLLHTPRDPPPRRRPSQPHRPEPTTQQQTKSSGQLGASSDPEGIPRVQGEVVHRRRPPDPALDR
jgi:hypothetical protein